MAQPSTATKKPRVTSSAARAQPPNRGAPIILADSVAVPSAGTTAFRADAYTNNTGFGLELWGLRTVIGCPSAGTPQAFAYNLNGIMALQLAKDDDLITRGFVPVWHLCKSDNNAADLASGAIGILGNTAESPTTSATWNFSSPIYLKPGESISASAMHTGVLSAALNISLSFFGRRVQSRQPNSHRLPYVFYWTSKAFAATDNLIDTTPGGALKNDLDRDLVVERITGRTPTNIQQSTFGFFFDGDDTDVAEMTVFPGIFDLSLRMSLSQSRQMIRDFTPFWSVFGLNNAWETGFILKPGDYVIASVQHVPISTPLNTATNYYQTAGSVALLSSREVA